MNGAAARQARPHHFRGAQQRRRLPVAFGTEPVAVGHQALDAEPWQLRQVAEVLEGIGERLEAAGVEERPESGLDPRCVAQRGTAVRRLRRNSGTMSYSCS